MDNAEEIGKAAGKLFVDAINKKPNIVLGLATGASPVPTYQYIYSEYQKGNVSLRDVVTYNLDEYVDLPKSDKNSYYSFMHTELFDHTDIREENVHFLDGNAADVEAECKRYDEALDRAQVDIQLLGIGRNGHIGFNEPSICFTKGAFKVKLTQSTISANSMYFNENPMPHRFHYESEENCFGCHGQCQSGRHGGNDSRRGHPRLPRFHFTVPSRCRCLYG